MKYKCCSMLMGGIEFRYNGIALCQRVDHIGGGDIVVQTYDDKKDKNFQFDTNKYFEKQKEIIEQNKTGKVYNRCVGCLELKKREWPEIEDIRINQIILHHWTKCNSHCMYCYTNKDKKYFNSRRNYNVLPILKQFDEKGEVIAYAGTCCFAGGEISCLKEFNDIVKLLDKYDYSYIFNSSCVKFEKTVEKCLQKGNGMLIVSTDCGNRELHKKIKQVDTFNTVWKNIKKYAEAAKDHKDMIYTKYIILKDINDNEQAITEFIEMSKQSGIETILMEIDHYYFCENRDNIPQYIIDLFYFAFNKAEEMGLKCQIYSNSGVLLLQGKYADKFWKPYLFDAGKHITNYSMRHILQIPLNNTNNISEYDDINSTATNNNLTYTDIWKICEENKNLKSINGYIYIYKNTEN
ncbi:MAG: radical SAM protein [Candidatus Gastranaerophilales bacterium]|nr:radical SAM protein [Candidatus Gastranaerophilales bacterium]